MRGVATASDLQILIPSNPLVGGLWRRAARSPASSALTLEPLERSADVRQSFSLDKASLESESTASATIRYKHLSKYGTRMSDARNDHGTMRVSQFWNAADSCPREPDQQEGR